jgi:hypothetical protein
MSLCAGITQLMAMRIIPSKRASLIISGLLFAFALSFAAGPKRNGHQETSIRLVAHETRKSTFDPPSSQAYSAVLFNDGKEPIRLNAVQMPGGYSGDGRFYPCYLQLWDRKKERWITHRLYEFYDGRATPNIVQVDVKPGTSLEVCNGLYPEQLGHVGDCARFALSPERGQEPIFFSNTFKIIGGKKRSHGADGCVGATK